MIEERFELNELVTQVLPRLKLPPHLEPRYLLDDDYEPPHRVAKQVYALRALVRNAGREGALTGKLATSRSVADHFGPILRNERVESVWIVGCDVRLRVRFYRCVSRGGVARCAVTVGEILRPLVLNATTGALMLHNHPSGDPSPSSEDIELTRHVAQGCDLLGIRFLDHIIVGASSYLSFLDAGLLAHPG